MNNMICSPKFLPSRWRAGFRKHFKRAKSPIDTTVKSPSSDKGPAQSPNNLSGPVSAGLTRDRDFHDIFSTPPETPAKANAVQGADEHISSNSDRHASQKYRSRSLPEYDASRKKAARFFGRHVGSVSREIDALINEIGDTGAEDETRQTVPVVALPSSGPEEQATCLGFTSSKDLRAALKADSDETLSFQASHGYTLSGETVVESAATEPVNPVTVPRKKVPAPLKIIGNKAASVDTHSKNSQIRSARRSTISAQCGSPELGDVEPIAEVETESGVGTDEGQVDDMTGEKPKPDSHERVHEESQGQALVQEPRLHQEPYPFRGVFQSYDTPPKVTGDTADPERPVFQNPWTGRKRGSTSNLRTFDDGLISPRTKFPSRVDLNRRHLVINTSQAQQQRHNNDERRPIDPRTGLVCTLPEFCKAVDWALDEANSYRSIISNATLTAFEPEANKPEQSDNRDNGNEDEVNNRPSEAHTVYPTAYADLIDRYGPRFINLVLDIVRWRNLARARYESQNPSRTRGAESSNVLQNRADALATLECRKSPPPPEHDIQVAVAIVCRLISPTRGDLYYDDPEGMLDDVLQRPAKTRMNRKPVGEKPHTKRTTNPAGSSSKAAASQTPELAQQETRWRKVVSGMEKVAEQAL